jgi:lysozyme family protein
MNPAQDARVAHAPGLDAARDRGFDTAFDPAFDRTFDRLIGNEGGYSHHPDDPGGETMWGITLAVARVSGYTGAMRELPRATAKDIYRSQYWLRAGADRYDAALGFQVFDAAVNHGIETALRFLQQAAGVPADGHIGPVSLAAINATPVARLLLRFMAARLRFWAQLSTFGSFGRGWVNRGAHNLDLAAEDL